MAKVTVYRYRKYDISRDDYVRSTRMATLDKIEKLCAEALLDKATEIDGSLLIAGEDWTVHNFDPHVSGPDPNSFPPGISR